MGLNYRTKERWGYRAASGQRRDSLTVIRDDILCSRIARRSGAEERGRVSRRARRRERARGENFHSTNSTSFTLSDYWKSSKCKSFPSFVAAAPAPFAVPVSARRQGEATSGGDRRWRCDRRRVPLLDSSASISKTSATNSSAPLAPPLQPPPLLPRALYVSDLLHVLPLEMITSEGAAAFLFQRDDSFSGY